MRVGDIGEAAGAVRARGSRQTSGLIARLLACPARSLSVAAGVTPACLVTSDTATVRSEPGPGAAPASSRPSELSATVATDAVGMVTGMAVGRAKDVISASRAAGVGDRFQAARLSRAASAGFCGCSAPASVVSQWEASSDRSGADRDVATVATALIARTSADSPARTARLLLDDRGGVRAGSARWAARRIFAHGFFDKHT